MTTARQALDRLDSTLTDAYAQAEAAVQAAERRADQADAVTAETKRLIERRTATLTKHANAKASTADQYAEWLTDAARACASPEPPTWGNLANTVKELAQDAERFKADYLAACKTIADMHEAATGRTGMGPIRGVVEDVADMRTECLAQWTRADEAEKRAYDAEQALSALRGVTDTDRAEKAEAERDRAREQRNTWARQADAEILEHRQRADQAEQDATRAEAALARVRNARTTAEAWAALGTYYGMPATEAGRSARDWRTAAELASNTRGDGWRKHALDADARADRFEAAWQNARLRAQQAKERERLANDRAERYRESRNHWTRQALDAAARNATEPITCEVPWHVHQETPPTTACRRSAPEEG
ncbi:hypothetical protein ACIBVM_18505 [[Kitasatospora] papulosa]|uniref:hypothetical protein n=1 Tax=[Kitasatospora] papulosa TaxID=1464011 RepID=UPI003792D57D